jgi:transposase
MERRVSVYFNFRPYNPKQGYLLPPSLDDWLPESHLARFISDAVDSMDLSGFYRFYRANGQGSAAYHPVMMVKILFYAYCVGMPSSRKIAKGLVDDVALRWLAAGNAPDFRTISEFRRQHLKILKSLFIQVLLLCRRAGLAKVGVVALDGTKVRANASLAKNRKYSSLASEEKKLLETVDRLLREAGEVDKREDGIYGSRRGDELPEGLATVTNRLRKIREAKAQLEAEAKADAREQEEKIEARLREEEETGKKKRGRKPKDPDEAVDDSAKANLTDLDSRIQKTRRGYIQGYNAQAMVSEDQIVVACDVVQDANDIHQLAPMVELTKDELKKLNEECGLVLADAGYCSEENLEYLLDPDSPNALIATRKDRKQRNDTDPPPRGRIPKDSRLRDLMDRKLRTMVGRALYGMRSYIVEPVFGQMKECRNLKRFLLRGLEKVKGEFSLWCITHNLLKIYRNNPKVVRS